MAGDWIPMRIDLYEDPAVIQLAEMMNVRTEVVVGYLHKVWSWVSRQCHDGNVTGVTLESLGSVTNLPGFPEMMAQVGWLEATECGFSIPHFDRWLSQSAKGRILAARRKREQRSRSNRDKSVTRVEESTGQENKKIPPKSPQGEEEKPRRQSKKFTPPTVEEVRAYCREKSYTFDAESFVAYYESNGWKVGKNQMKSWHSACVTWQKNSANNGQPQSDRSAIKKESRRILDNAEAARRQALAERDGYAEDVENNPIPRARFKQVPGPGE